MLGPVAMRELIGTHELASLESLKDGGFSDAGTAHQHHLVHGRLLIHWYGVCHDHLSALHTLYVLDHAV